MASLDAALSEMDRIITEVQASPRIKNTADRVKAVVEVRSNIIRQVGIMNECLSSDARLQGDPALAKAFGEKLGALRQKLAALQAKWRSSEMAEKFEAYAVESTPVAQACKDFVKWAKDARVAA
jgi:hypothetical protein